MGKKILFDSKSKLKLLNLFGKDVDDDNYIVDIKTKERVLTPNGEQITIDEFGGFRKGSEIFIKKDITSLVNYVQE